MTTLNKLHTFTLRDRFSWNRQQILAEANDMALRHADMMGWERVELRDISAIPTKDGEYLCYRFEIWGVEGASNQDSAEQFQANDPAKSSPHAARQPEL